MAKILGFSLETINKIILLISGYTMLELISLYSFNLTEWVKYDLLKAFAVIAPLIWYIYLFTKAITSRRIRRENETIDRKNKEIEQDILIKKRRIQEAQLQRIEFENRLLEKKIKEQEKTDI